MLTVEGNITYFINPLVINEGYDRDRFAQAYVMDGDVTEETRKVLGQLRDAHNELSGEPGVRRSIFRTSVTWQTFINKAKNTVRKLRDINGGRHVAESDTDDDNEVPVGLI